MGPVDPFSVLGVSPEASPEEIAAAYRRLAKRWHPDRRPGPEAAARMAQVNAAYDAARALAAQPHPTAVPRPAERPRRRPAAGAWLEAGMRRALGAELMRALHDREAVRLVVPTSTWASPQSRLAITDRRLLWLLEDAITDRVRSLRFDAIDSVDHRLAWPRRRTATVRVRDRHGRRLTFSELEPATAAEVVGHVRARLAA